jgi:hypothetical protein
MKRWLFFASLLLLQVILVAEVFAVLYVRIYGVLVVLLAAQVALGFGWAMWRIGRC